MVVYSFFLPSAAFLPSAHSFTPIEFMARAFFPSCCSPFGFENPCTWRSGHAATVVRGGPYSFLSWLLLELLSCQASHTPYGGGKKEGRCKDRRFHFFLEGNIGRSQELWFVAEEGGLGATDGEFHRIKQEKEGQGTRGNDGNKSKKTVLFFFPLFLRFLEWPRFVSSRRNWTGKRTTQGTKEMTQAFYITFETCCAKFRSHFKLLFSQNRLRMPVYNGL